MHQLHNTGPVLQLLLSKESATCHTLLPEDLSFLSLSNTPTHPHTQAAGTRYFTEGISVNYLANVCFYCLLYFAAWNCRRNNLGQRLCFQPLSEVFFIFFFLEFLFGLDSHAGSHVYRHHFFSFPSFLTTQSALALESKGIKISLGIKNPKALQDSCATHTHTENIVIFGNKMKNSVVVYYVACFGSIILGVQ